MAFGSIVVADNRLHALGQAKYNHYKDELHAVGDTVGCNGEVAIVAVRAQSLVDDDDHYACSSIYKERRETDTQYSFYYIALEAVYAALEMEQFIRVAEHSYLPYEGCALCQYCCECGTSYAPSKYENECWCQYHVHHDCYNGGYHRLFWMSCRAQGCVYSKIEMGDDVAQQYNLHEIACERQSVLTGAEEYQDFVKEYE